MTRFLASKFTPVVKHFIDLGREERSHYNKKNSGHRGQDTVTARVKIEVGMEGFLIEL